MVSVIQTEYDKMTINGKLLYIDSNGRWVATQELTIKETEAFHSHISN